MNQKAKQRVAIAKDVIALIEAKKIAAIKGSYFIPKTQSKYVGEQLQEVLPKVKKCGVCVIGGLFYAYVMRYNEYMIRPGAPYRITIKYREIKELLKNIFSDGQLYLIEGAFEKKDVVQRMMRLAGYNYETKLRSVTYRAKHNLENDEEALVHIMQNIINNNGVFRV